ncbi:MAG: AsnC family transcriptional regulator [Candidatus Wukongarchaeota archaeon]|nr:Lrp/AsnC family transcriptional regulator [Candidatus Wukongarchaeota archaeon]
MDNFDKEILRILKENAREKFVIIAKKVGLSEGAVRQRIKKMIRLGIIGRFTVDMGAFTEAFVMIKTDPVETKAITKQVKTKFEKVYEVSGEYDIALLLTTENIDELNDKVDEIRKIKGVIDTNTLIRLS